MLRRICSHTCVRCLVLVCVTFGILMLSVVGFAETITDEFDQGLDNWEIAQRMGNAEYVSLVNEGGKDILAYQHDKSAWLGWMLPDPAVGNYAIEATVRFDFVMEYSSFGIVLRQNGTEEWVGGGWNLNNYQILFNPNGYITLHRRVNWDVDKTTVSAELPFRIKPRQWYLMRTEIKDDTIVVLIDGQEVFRWQDPKPLPAGTTWMSFGQGKTLVDKIVWMPLE
jgi:hypothetical protein